MDRQSNRFHKLLKNLFDDEKRLSARTTRAMEKEEKKREKLDRQQEQQQERQRKKEFQESQKKERQRETTLYGKQPHSQASFGENLSKIEELDEEFQEDIRKLEQKMCQLNFPNKIMAATWKTRLQEQPHSEEEARSRNIIATYLVRCCDDGVFEREPFNKAPPPKDLFSLRKEMYLTRESSCRIQPPTAAPQGNSHVRELFEKSYDGGEFLRQLPVPRDGAFFITHLRPNL